MSRRNPSGSLLLAAGLAAATLIGVGLGVGVGPADASPDLPCSAAGSACVVVEVVNADGSKQPPYYLGVGDLSGSGAGSQADVRGATYAVPGSSAINVNSGTSVNKVITEAGVTDVSKVFAEVDGPDGYGRHLLTGAELDPPGPGNPNPPVFYPNPTSNDASGDDYVNFIRPSRNADDDQLEPGPDQGSLLSGRDGSLTVVVHLGGSVLTPTVTATPVDGSDRSFALSCAGCAGLTPTWYFPDGSTSADAAPTYTFRSGDSAGTYLIAVSVERASDGSFGWGTTRTQIGPAPTPSASPSAGPTGTGGRGRGHTGSTHHGSGHTGPGSGHGQGGGGGASPTAKPSSSPTRKPDSSSSAAPTSLPSPEPSSSLYVAASDGPLTVPTTAPRPTPSDTPSAAPTEVPTDIGSPATGTEVTGVLLTDPGGVVGAQDTGSRILDEASPSAAAAPLVDPPFRVDPLLWLAVGGVVLLGAGAASESDGVRRRLRPLARRLRRWARIEA